MKLLLWPIPSRTSHVRPCAPCQPALVYYIFITGCCSSISPTPDVYVDGAGSRQRPGDICKYSISRIVLCCLVGERSTVRRGAIWSDSVRAVAQPRPPASRACLVCRLQPSITDMRDPPSSLFGPLLGCLDVDLLVFTLLIDLDSHMLSKYNNCHIHVYVHGGPLLGATPV